MCIPDTYGKINTLAISWKRIGRAIVTQRRETYKLCLLLDIKQKAVP